MHGLVNRGLQSFIVHTFGQDLWQKLVLDNNLTDGFEALSFYDDTVTDAILTQALDALDRKKPEFLEDFGTYLVTSEATNDLRRLMRFGGVDFPDFLDSLPDLPGRIKMAIPDFILPEIDVTDDNEGALKISVGSGMSGLSYVLVGILRAMADDYGVLAEISHQSCTNGKEIRVLVLDKSFGTGRDFSLVGAA